MKEFDEAVRRIRKALWSVFAISGVTSVLMLALPFYMMQVFIRVLPSRSVETLLVLSLLAAVAFIALAVFDALRQAILARVAVLYESLLSGPVVYAHFLDGSRDPSSGSELIADIRQVRSFLGSKAPASIAEAPFIPVFLFVIFMIAIPLGLLITVGMGVMILMAIMQQSAMKRGIEIQSESQRDSNRLLQSHIDQAEIVRVHGLQKTAIDRWGHSSAENLTSYVDLQTVGGVYGGISKAIRFGLQAAILGFGAYLAIQGEISAIVVFAAMMIGGRALAPLDGLVGSWSALTSALAAHKRVRKAMETFEVESDPTELPAPKGEIQVEKLVYASPASPEAIIKRIGFTVPANSSVGIVGPSGAGKSTLLRLLAGAIAPSGGAVRLDGADLRNWNRMQLGPYIGYVPQAVEFFPGTVGQNIARFDPEATDELIVTAAKHAGVHDMILRFPKGYDTMIGASGFRPSGGQKQLLAIARALYRDPKLLFLDEPNSNLDQYGDNILVGALKSARERGATIVLVTQRPILLNATDRVLVLRDGMIEDYGPREEVVAKLSKPARAISQKDQRPPKPAVGQNQVAAGQAPAQVTQNTTQNAAQGSSQPAQITATVS